MADLRLAAWLAWMTPLLAALSSALLASRMRLVAAVASPASAVVRQALVLLLASSAARLAIADLRLAAWLAWMTPLLAALSS